METKPISKQGARGRMLLPGYGHENGSGRLWREPRGQHDNTDATMHVEQALCALIHNALEAMPEGGVLSVKSILVSTYSGPEPETFSMLEIRDTGANPEHAADILPLFAESSALDPEKRKPA